MLAFSCKHDLKSYFASDDPETKTGFTKACACINTELSPLFKDKELPLPKKTFEAVTAWLSRREQKINDCLIRAVFEALLFSYGQVISPEAPYFSHFNFLNARDISLRTLRSPKLMFTVLNGGKASGSKVKIATFYLILEIQGSDDCDASDIYFKVSALIKKLIVSHKLGENGFKANQTGAYFNAYESINDSFKLLEEAINQSQVNKGERKYAQIGINVDSASWYLPEQDRYEMEGPKNLMDQTALTEWLAKMVTDHPLLTFIEDPFRPGDLVGYQRLVNRLKDRGVTVSVKQWFGSDLVELKKHTQLIHPEAETSDEETDKENKAPEEVKEQVQEPPKEEEVKKPDPKGKPVPAQKETKPPASKGGRPEVQAPPEEVKDPNDPNCDKIRPHAIHFERSKHATTAAMLETITYLNFLKEDERIGLVIDDCSFESRQASIVDFAFATQCAYLNLRGICKPERAAKVERFQEIMEDIRANQ